MVGGGREPAFAIVFAVAVVVAAGSLAAGAVGRASRTMLLRRPARSGSFGRSLGRVRARSVDRARGLGHGPARLALSCPSRRSALQRRSREGGRSTRRSSARRPKAAEVARTEVSRRSASSSACLRGRADSLSAYAEEERRLAETRRAALGESERRLRDGLAEAFSKVQGQVEQRLASWHQDRDLGHRAARHAAGGDRPARAVADRGARSATTMTGRRVKAADDEQKAAVSRLREDLARTAAEAAVNAAAELRDSCRGAPPRVHQAAERIRPVKRDLLAQSRARGGDASCGGSRACSSTSSGGRSNSSTGARPRGGALRRRGCGRVRGDGQSGAGGCCAQASAQSSVGAGVCAARRVAARGVADATRDAGGSGGWREADPGGGRARAPA